MKESYVEGVTVPTMNVTFASMALLLLWVGAGCGEAKIDGSTEETFTRSVEEVRQSLGTEEQVRFDQAMAVLAGAQQWPETGASGSIEHMVHGKTAREAIELCQQFVAERRQALRASIEEKIRELERLRAVRKEALEGLKEFVVTVTDFRVRDDGALIMVNIKNGTPHKVSTVHLHAILKRPVSGTPLAEDEIMYEFPKPVASNSIFLSGIGPSTSWNWARVPNHDGMTLELIIKRIDGPDGEPIYDSRISDKDGNSPEFLAERVESLTAQVRSLPSFQLSDGRMSHDGGLGRHQDGTR